LTVKEIMDTWTLQMGYPVLEVIRNYSSGTFKLKQKWFLVNPLSQIQNNKFEYNKYRWYIPVTYTNKIESDFRFEKETLWFKPKEAESKLRFLYHVLFARFLSIVLFY
jgi:aminopeptidase N